MQIEVVVEIPKGTRNKYEADEAGALWLDRTLYTATQYPEDYGFVPGTLGQDGDPLDALILLPEPTFPGCHVRARPIGMFSMADEEGIDDKLLCVPDGDARWESVRDLEDVSPFDLDRIAHFFAVYKDVEPGKHTEPGEWHSCAVAERTVDEAIQRHADR